MSDDPCPEAPAESPGGWLSEPAAPGKGWPPPETPGWAEAPDGAPAVPTAQGPRHPAGSGRGPGATASPEGSPSERFTGPVPGEAAPTAAPPEDPDVAGRRSPWFLATAVLLLAALALALPPALKRRRRRQRRAALGTRARVAGAWSEALDRLREMGSAPAAALTPLEFAGRARAGAADVGPALARLARLFTKASYASGGPSEEEAGQAWAEVEAITRALDSGDSLFGRWRHRLNPATLVARPARGNS